MFFDPAVGVTDDDRRVLYRPVDVLRHVQIADEVDAQPVVEVDLLDIDQVALRKGLVQVAASATASLRLASPAEDAQLVSASTPQATRVAPSNGRTRCQRDRLVAIS